jgi:two-component system, chemotaxis family, sensor kinase CheA
MSGVSVLDYELIRYFLEEATDSLIEWERACLILESTESDEALDALFRAAHNMKGGARAASLSHFAEFIHRAEDVINLVRKKELPVFPGLITVFLDCQVFLLRWIDALKEDPAAVRDDALLLRRIEFLRGNIPSGRSHSSSDDEPSERSEPIPSPESQKKRINALFLAAKKRRTEVPVASNLMRKDSSKLPSEPTSPCELSSLAPPSVRKEVSKPDPLLRVSSRKLDELIRLVGELSIHQSIASNSKSSSGASASAAQHGIQKITKELYAKALSLRMQPLQASFQRLERMAKDVARDLSKEIQVIVEGAEVELDRSVIERITDPLIHVVRNACDHGLETSLEREVKGKGRCGTLWITAQQEPSGVSLRIRDDGRGLNVEKILEKAIQKGLVSNPVGLSRNEIFQFILHPGFSTAEKITDLSGRGVGLDVVLKVVQELKGTFDIQSEVGKGTEFSIHLPTTLSIVEGLVIALEGERYAVAMNELAEIIDLVDYPVERSGTKGKMLSLRGEVLPLLPLREFLSVQEGSRNLLKREESSTPSKPALIVRNGRQAIALEVDAVLGQEQIVVRPLSAQLASLKSFSGSTIFGDGEPGVIVDLHELAMLHFSQTDRTEGA